ncbi:MAG TPA: Ku protein [Acidisphaera sp.]|nr:Ku protein [Acidisphaera sp.]
MAQRPIWRGHLRLALVSCPVALYTARHDSSNLHFNLINPKTGHRVRMLTVDAETGEEIAMGDLVKGYEFKKDHYVLLDDEDFERARIDSSGTMTVDKFVPADSIDPIYYEDSYYVVPDGEAGQDVYVVLREALRQTGRVALTRVVISRRARAVVLMPMDRGLVAHTLHEQQDVNSPKALFDQVPRQKPDPEMVKLAVQLVDRQTGKFDPADMEDRYEVRLRAVIEAKLKGEGVEAAAEADVDRGNVIDLMAALKRSLGQTVETPKGRGAASRPAAKKAETPPRRGSTKTGRKSAVPRRKSA